MSHVIYGTYLCNQTQVQPPEASKANTWEAGADVKERGLFRCQPPGRWGPHVSKPVFLGIWGTLVSTSISHLSAGRSFYKEGEGKKSKDIKGRGLKSSLHADKHSPFQ